MLDVENPGFTLDVCVRIMKLSAITNSDTPKFLQFFEKLPISNGWQFLRLYLMKPMQWLRIKAGTLISSLLGGVVLHSAEPLFWEDLNH